MLFKIATAVVPKPTVVLSGHLKALDHLGKEIVLGELGMEFRFSILVDTVILMDDVCIQGDTTNCCMVLEFLINPEEFSKPESITLSNEVARQRSLLPT